MKPFNLEECMTKHGGKCVTRDGREARIVFTDRKGHEYPVGALICDGEIETLCSFTADGKVFKHDSKDDKDLFLPSTTVKAEGWLNIYPNDGPIFFKTKIEAEESAVKHMLIACIRVTYEYEV